MRPAEVSVGALPLDRFRGLVADFSVVEQGLRRATETLGGRTVWHVNSTGQGGGVAELLAALGPYVRGAGIDFRWMVIAGDERFFALTKRLHNNLHGSPGDGGELTDADRAHYEGVLGENARGLAGLIRRGDIVVLHDPQTAGLVEAMRELGAKVVWRCHVGIDRPNEIARRAWQFLDRYVAKADGLVFSREVFVWEQLSDSRVWVIAPSIDAFSAKNQELGADQVRAILVQIGLLEGGGDGLPTFVRRDGAPGRVDRRALIDQAGPLPGEAALVSQISRWDRLKDHLGVLESFARHVTSADAHLLLAGPPVEGIADDPEGAEVLAEIRATREGLDQPIRDRVHVARLPMEDLEENAVMVNAIQRHSTVIVQKSIAEGFGLTVGEAMWKGRAVIGTRIGGIADQIVDRESGLLLDDPTDLPGLGRLIDQLLGDPELVERLGTAARERIRDRFLGARHLLQYLDVMVGVLDPEATQP